MNLRSGVVVPVRSLVVQVVNEHPDGKLSRGEMAFRGALIARRGEMPEVFHVMVLGASTLGEDFDAVKALTDLGWTPPEDLRQGKEVDNANE